MWFLRVPCRDVIIRTSHWTESVEERIFMTKFSDKEQGVGVRWPPA
jgi:hypothetical protein